MTIRTQQYLDKLHWVYEHGGTLAGYIQRYGSKDDPEHYGEGGEAIYAADIAELNRLCWSRRR
jgi:hypothetical protein